MEKKEKKLYKLNKLGRIFAYCVAIYGIICMFLLIVCKDTLLEVYMNSCTFEEIIYQYNAQCAFSSLLIAASIFIFIELNFLKFNLYKEYRIKTQKGEIVHNEEC